MCRPDSTPTPADDGSTPAAGPGRPAAATGHAGQVTSPEGREQVDGAVRALAAAASLGPLVLGGARRRPRLGLPGEAHRDACRADRQVDEVRAMLAAGPGPPDVQPRVAASLVHLGLVARLAAPLVGAGLTTGVVSIACTSRPHRPFALPPAGRR